MAPGAGGRALIDMLWHGLMRAVCGWLGCDRDWPEMERCSRCGLPMPLESDP